jgi:preprotein translocase subunit SecF
MNFNVPTMSIIPLWVKIAILLAVVSAIFGSGFYEGYHYGFDKRDLTCKTAIIDQQKADAKAVEDQRRENETQRTKIADLSGQLQKSLSKVHVVYRTTKSKTSEEVKKPIYSTCVVPATGVKIISDAAASYNAILEEAGK